MTQSGTLRVGVIGCGFFAPNHLHAWLGLEGVRISAICDRSEDRLKAAAAIVGDVPQFTSSSALFQSGLCDFVDIITSPSTHHDLVLEAARHRMPAIVQKPMATSLADATDMVAAMQAAGVPFVVHENFRFQDAIASIRTCIDQGQIGDPVYGRVAFRTGWDIYGGQPYLATEKRFVIADLGVHVLDVARFLFGEAERVTCAAKSVKPGLAGEDMASMLLQHAGGAISVVECSYASHLADDYFPQTLITVEGTDGGIVLGPDYQMSMRSGDKVERWNAEPPRLDWMQAPWHGVQASVRATQAHWLQRFREHSEPQTSGRDNLMTMRLVEAAYQSLQTGGTVSP